MEQETTILVAESYGRGIGNLVIQNAKFFGRPNFRGEMNQWKDDRRQFTVLIPNEHADKLREIGWNVKTMLPRPEYPEDEQKSHLKVMVDFRFDAQHPGDVEYEKGPDIWVIQGEQREKLTSKTVGILDTARFENIDLELRGWEYNPDENPGAYSARLVMLVAVMRPSVLGEKYNLR